MRTMTIADWTLKTGATLVIAFLLGMPIARADALLDEMVGFTGQIFFIDTKVPAVVIGAVRDGDTAVAGFGERAGPGSPAPDGDTIMRIGSITQGLHRRRARPHGRQGHGGAHRSSDEMAARPWA
jgi:hypothetical protein